MGGNMTSLEIIYETPSDEKTGDPIPNLVRAIVLEIDDNGIRMVDNIFECNTKRAVRSLLKTYYSGQKLPRAIDRTRPAPTEAALPEYMNFVTERYGTPGGNTFPYLMDKTEIAYAPSMKEAYELFLQQHDHEPYSIQLMADNE
jgi:hypothetical protein